MKKGDFLWPKMEWRWTTQTAAGEIVKKGDLLWPKIEMTKARRKCMFCKKPIPKGQPVMRVYQFVGRFGYQGFHNRRSICAAPIAL